MDILADGAGRHEGLLAGRIGRALVQVIPGPPGSGFLGVATLVSWTITAGLGGYMLWTWLARGGLRRRRETGDGPPPKVVFTHFGLAVGGLAVWAAFVATDWPPLAWAAGFALMPVVGLGVSTLTLWTPYPAPRPAAPHAPGAAGDVGGAGAPDDRPAGAPGKREPEGAGSALTRGMLATPAEDMLARKLTDEVLNLALTDDVVAGRLADLAVANAAHQPPAPDRRGHLAPLVAVGHGFAAIATVLLAMLTVVSTV